MIHSFIVNNLSPSALWFLINSTYFPSDLEVVKEHIEELSEVLSSFSGDIGKLSIKRGSQFKNRLNLVNELLSLNSYYEKEEELNNSTGNSSSSAQESMSNVPFTFNELENKLYETLSRVKQINEKRTYNLKKKMPECINENYWSESMDKDDDLFRDMKFNQKEQRDYYDYFHRQQRKKIKRLYQAEKIFEIEEEINRTKEDDDWVCCICNNGDDDENQLIYECESCAVTVHQGCYGIKTNSVQHWTCNPCNKMSKNEALKLECILCRVKGGAMKQVQLPRNCAFVRNILGCREDLSSDLSSSLNDETTSDHIFPKYNSSIIIPLQDYSMINCAWAHLSCALWNPLVSFGNFEEKTQIGNLEMIEYKQFEEKCNVCNMRNYGPTLRCNTKGCSFKCHPECARINQYHLEIENDKGTLNYNIYCLEHEPIKLLKGISTRRNLMRKDIEEFDDILRKIYRSFEQKYEVSPISVQPQGKLLSSLFERYNSISMYSKEHSLRKCAIVIENSKQPLITTANINNLNLSLNQNQKLFLAKFNTLCKSYSHSNRIILRKRNVNQRESYTRSNQSPGQKIEYEIDDCNNYNLLSYDDLFRSDFPWEEIRFKNYSRQNLKEYFKKLVIDHECYEALLKKGFNQLMQDEPKKRVEIIQENGEKTVREFEEDTNLYCYCKRRYSPGDIMICCERGFACLGSHDGWYHVQCIDQTKCMSQEEIDSFKFICTLCRKGD